MTCYIAKNMVAFVREGFGITVLSTQVALSEMDDDISLTEINPTIKRNIYLVTRNSQDMQPTLKLLLNHAKEWVAEQTTIEEAKDAFISSVLEGSCC